VTVPKEPPPGPPWDLPLDEAPLAFVDLEMTGLDAKKDRVVEICIERVAGEEVKGRVFSLVRPESGETGNVHIHNIDATVLANAPTWKDLHDEIASLLDGAVVVAHGASWDVGFLEAESHRVGRPLSIPFYIDTLNLSRRTLGLPKHSLDALRTHFGLDTSRAHRADADVAALREVWRRCIAVLEPKTPRDVWEVRIAERKAREHIVAECTACAQDKAVALLTYRPRAKPPEEIRLVVTHVDFTLEPPRVVGYELPGRGRRELRADRILKVVRDG